MTRFLSETPISKFPLWDKMRDNKRLLSFDLELTARCNNNCRHCYINLPADDRKAMEKELTLPEINSIADQSVSLGAIWCLVTGGEPLLRKDFFDIYLCLKKKGLLVSVFTNATLINESHVEFFKRYPPRDIEVTVYGATKRTYEGVTRKRGSFGAFTRGLDLLLRNGIKVRFKAMALRSNLSELPEISRFCRERTKDYFRFDPFLHLRLDGDKARNEEIRSERLTPGEIAAIEQADPDRFQALEKNCDKLIVPDFSRADCNHLFHCGAGNSGFTVSHDGLFRLCSSLTHPACVCDIRKGGLSWARDDLVPRVRSMRSDRESFLKRCRVCPIINLCSWCPAHSYLENGELDKPVDYFCDVAHARARLLSASI